MTKEEYDNGSVFDISQFTSKEREIAFSGFSEGSKYLKEALIQCFDNGIKTKGCCKGHIIERKGRFDAQTGEEIKHRRLEVVNSSPYLSINIDIENLYHIFNLIDKASEMDGLEIVLLHHQKDETLILKGKGILDRKRLFGMISREAKNMQHFEEMSDECKEFWLLYNDLISAKTKDNPDVIQNIQLILQNTKHKAMLRCITDDEMVLGDILIRNGVDSEEQVIKKVNKNEMANMIANIRREMRKFYTFDKTKLRKGTIKEQVPEYHVKKQNFLSRLRVTKANTTINNGKDTSTRNEMEIDGR